MADGTIGPVLRKSEPEGTARRYSEASIKHAREARTKRAVLTDHENHTPQTLDVDASVRP